MPGRGDDGSAERRIEGGEIGVESGGERSDGTALAHPELRPAVEISPEGAIGSAQIDVLAAGFRHSGGQLRVGERAEKAQNASDDPNDEELFDGPYIADHGGGHEKDPAADDGADNDRNSAPYSENPLKARAGCRGAT